MFLVAYTSVLIYKTVQPQVLWGDDCVMKCIDVKCIVIVFRDRHYRLWIVEGCGGGAAVHIFGLSQM